jgi:FkbH-like protein
VKLSEALNTLQAVKRSDAAVETYALACGFSALHLSTFLTAHLQQSRPGARVCVGTGLYGDTVGSIRTLAQNSAGLAVVLEWEDLDPRLGLRSGARRAAVTVDELLEQIAIRLTLIEQAIVPALSTQLVALAPPSLPLRSVDHTPNWHAGSGELRLQAAADEFSLRLQRLGVKVVSSQKLGLLAPLAERADPGAELRTGFPYRIPFADTLAQALSALLLPVPPKKGLIIDLDDTMWRGILGEVGVARISWDLTDGAQNHAILQQAVGQLAGAGVLVAIASKNDPALADEALARPDLLIPRAALFPVLAGWGPKSESVRRTLGIWNIAADAVVFVDDSEMELAEVTAACPGITSLRFPKDDTSGVINLTSTLRDLFGKATITQEDLLRSASIRASASLPHAEDGSGNVDEQFLAGMAPVVTFRLPVPQDDPRPLELMNKTNQFNLNGRRWTDAEWRAGLADPNRLLLDVAYSDQYGPLGRIATLTGLRESGKITVDGWVMSCRAFSRRIEHATLRYLFDRLAARELLFTFTPTDRNGPLQAFLASVLGRLPEAGTVALSRDRFIESCPALYHKVEPV